MPCRRSVPAKIRALSLCCSTRRGATPIRSYARRRWGPWRGGRNPKILDTLRAAIDDPDATVQRRAISTLNSLPDGEGIPLLIQVIKTTKDAQVRKEAMNALQASRDPRALNFFEDVLK